MVVIVVVRHVGDRLALQGSNAMVEYVYCRKGVGGRGSQDTVEPVTSGSRRALFDAFRAESPCC